MRDRFRRLFRGSEDWFGQYEAAPDGSKIRAWTTAGPVPDEAWDRHLAGEQPGIGIVPITDEGTCYWGCIDLDDDETDHAALVKKVRQLGLPFVVCRSKSGGAHLFLFFREPISPIKLVAKLKRWSLQLQLENPPDDQGRRPDLEIFPKQIRLEEGQKGNWLNIPYFGGDDTTRYGLDDEGEPLSLEEFLDYVDQFMLTENLLEAKQAVMDVDADAFFSDGPPCLQSLHETGFAKGTRNAGLYNVGIFLKLKHPDDWESMLNDYNRESGRIDPPLDDDEVKGIVRSLRRNDYIYKCSDAPLVGVCKRGPCKKQEYGIDKFRRDAEDAAFPSLGRLVCFENEVDEPVYSLEIKGKQVTLRPDELLMIHTFKRVVFRQAKVVVPGMKQRRWDERLRDLLEDQIIVEVPVDAGPKGQFLTHLEQFLELRKKADREEDLLDNKPYQRNGKVYFRSQALIEFLERQKFRDVSVHGMGVWSQIRREGGGFTQVKVAGKDLDVWWLPVPENEQTEDLPLKDQDAPEF